MATKREIRAILHKPVGQHTLVKTVEEALEVSHRLPPNVVSGDVMVLGGPAFIHPQSQQG